MKLATRYQRSNLLVTLMIFLLASGAFYLLLHRVLLFQMDEDLDIERHEIETYVQRFGALPQNVLQVEDQIVRYQPVAKASVKPVRQTKLMWDAVERDSGAFRQLVFSVRAGNQWYSVSVSKSLEATEGLTRLIGLIALATIALLLLVSFLINQFVLRRLWKPFYKTVEKLRAFELDNNNGFSLPNVPTEEFDLLNKTLEAATGKALRDYVLLKQFTENASHELQTPLAIVRSKLDLLIQDEALSESQSSIIHDAYSALSRMAHLSHSLLTLTKIESGQYTARSGLDMKSLLSQKLLLFDAMLQERRLEVMVSLAPARLCINDALADILLNNLLSNAIYHNISGGSIAITLEAERLVICNTSAHGALSQNHLFTRFFKTTANATRTGLGLAITKQVCEAAGCTIEYCYTPAELHCFTIRWERAQAL